MFMQSLKPLHGWRSFMGEVGIIMLGVLLALGVQQLAEAMHWRAAVRTSRAALIDDVAGTWGVLDARRIVQPCVDKRLADIGRVLDRHAKGQPLGIVGPIGRPAVWTSPQVALTMAQNDGSLPHFDSAERAAYFRVKDSYDIFQQSAMDERASWRQLGRLDDAATLTAQDWAEIRHAYRDAQDSNQILSFNLNPSDANSWTAVFHRFPGQPRNKAALETPTVKELCAPAVTA